MRSKKNNEFVFTFIAFLIPLSVLITLFLFEKHFNETARNASYAVLAAYICALIAYYTLKINRLNAIITDCSRKKTDLYETSVKYLHESLTTAVHDERIRSLLNELEPAGKQADADELIKDLIFKTLKIAALSPPPGNDSRINIDINSNDGVGHGNILIKQKYHSDIMVEFIRSIINNTLNVSGPLSDSLLQIKSKTSDFLGNVEKWKKEFNDAESDKNFNNIIGKYEMQNKNFENVFMLINKNYLHMERNFDNIINMVDRIVKNTGKIDEISEKIRILSINASIEAARAGEFGRGFKIVSEEVKKLSNETQISNRDILPLAGETKKTVNQSVSEYNNELMNIINIINKEKEEFRTFYEILKNYYTDLNNLFSSVTQMINDINQNIDGLTPLFQFSNLSIQEMENLIKMINGFISSAREEIDKKMASMDENAKKNVLNGLMTEIRSVITTESEVSVFNNMVEINSLEIKTEEKKKRIYLELF